MMFFLATEIYRNTNAKINVRFWLQTSSVIDFHITEEKRAKILFSNLKISQYQIQFSNKQAFKPFCIFHSVIIKILNGHKIIHLTKISTCLST